MSRPEEFQTDEALDAEPVLGELVIRCSVCGAQLDPDDIFCANCGTQSPVSDQKGQRDRPESDLLTHHYVCDGCGAAMSYDASAQNLRCPFCSSEKLRPQPNEKTLRAKLVVPFQTSEKKIVELLRKWMGSSIWRPSSLAQEATITKVTPVYVPYWVFSTRADTYWTADTNEVPWHARGDWRPMTGDHQSKYHGILVGASSVLTPMETSSICPFNMNAGKQLSQSDLKNNIVEPFRVQRKYARPLARVAIEEFEREACRKLIPGRARNVKVNTRLTGLFSDPVLLPVWILAYRYKGETYRFLANGQTGQHTGTAPFSTIKIVFAVLGAILGIGLVLALITLIASPQG